MKQNKQIEKLSNINCAHTVWKERPLTVPARQASVPQALICQASGRRASVRRGAARRASVRQLSIRQVSARHDSKLNKHQINNGKREAHKTHTFFVITVRSNRAVFAQH